MCRLLIGVASLVAEHELWGTRASLVVVRRLYSTGMIVVVPGLTSYGHVGSSWIRVRTCVSCIGRWVLYQ